MCVGKAHRHAQLDAALLQLLLRLQQALHVGARVALQAGQAGVQPVRQGGDRTLPEHRLQAASMHIVMDHASMLQPAWASRSDIDKWLEE